MLPLVEGEHRKDKQTPSGNKAVLVVVVEVGIDGDEGTLFCVVLLWRSKSQGYRVSRYSSSADGE